MEKTVDQNISCLKKELQLGNGEKTINLKIRNILLLRVSNSSSSINTSIISENMFDLDFLSLQDENLMNILEELQNRTEVSRDSITAITSSFRLKGQFDTFFNLSHRVLSDAEIKILEKGLDFIPIQRKVMNQN